MSKCNMDEFNREKWKMPRWAKYTTSLIAGVFMAFVLGWLFLIPVAVVVLLAYGLVVSMKDRKPNRSQLRSSAGRLFYGPRDRRDGRPAA